VANEKIERVYENPWFYVAKEGKWHYLVEKNADNGAVVLILEDDKYFIFVESYRKPLDEVVVEVPRGYGEEGESSLESALREAYEETGYEIDRKDIIKLGTVHPNSGILSSELDIYFANVASESKTKGSDDEVIGIVKVDKDEVDEMIANGKIKDSFSLAAFSFYKARKDIKK